MQKHMIYKDVTGHGSFTATKYGTRCLAHEYGTTPKVQGGVPYSCAGHRVPYLTAVKEPNPVTCLLYALGLFLI